MLVNMDLPLIELPRDLPNVKRLAAHGSIAQSLQVVEALRKARAASPELAQRTQALRLWQSQRFRQSYSDILQDKYMGAAALFFLTELYSDQEFSQRDAQFARIAGTLERLFPQSVVQTATLLAQLHALSESLDACMALTWLNVRTTASAQLPFDAPDSIHVYHQLWRALLDHPNYGQARQEQLEATHNLGLQLQRHTQIPGLRLMLKMMRAPATAAGLHDLQRFLESGFDTFGQLGRAGKVPVFLQIVNQRETAWLARMAE
jgi:hypothetical protein